MKKLGFLMLIVSLGVWGCMAVDNSTVVDADQSGYATGQFRDVRHGQVCDFGIVGGGAGAAAASAATGLVSTRHCYERSLGWRWSQCQFRGRRRHVGLKGLSGSDPGRPDALCQVDRHDQLQQEIDQGHL